MNYRNLNYEDPNDIKKAILNLSCCTSSGSGLELGAELTGGDPNAVLHLDGSSQLATEPTFTYEVGDNFTISDIANGLIIREWSIANTYTEIATNSGSLFVSNGLIHRYNYLNGITFSQGNSSTGVISQSSGTSTTNVFGWGLTSGSDVDAKTHFKSTAVTDIVNIVEGMPGQTANLQEWRVNSSTGAYIDSNYQFYTTEGVRIQSNGSGGSIYLGCGYGGGKNIGLSRGARLGWSQFGDNSQSSITYIEANDSTGVMDFGASGGFRFNNYIQTSGYIFNGTLLINTNRIYNSSTTNGTLQFGSNTIDVVDATLSVTNDDVADITMIVDAITGTTANLQEWQVNGTTVASVTSLGKGNFDRIACSAVQSEYINTQSNSNTVIKLTNGSSDALFYGGIKPATLTDASAPNNSIYYSSTAGKLVYKDSGGTVNNLY